jgi:ribosomal protein L11 methylase PrmA
VLAVDVEQASVEATRENAAANGVELEVRRVRADDALPPADVAVANISLEAVLRLPARIDADLLVTSGYLAAERPELPGWNRLHRRERDGWAADLHRRA